VLPRERRSLDFRPAQRYLVPNSSSPPTQPGLDMFVGHYGVSFAVKSVERKIPLWLLFLAVQFVDILWGIFVLVGVEKVRIVPGIRHRARSTFTICRTPTVLWASIGWSVLAALVYKISTRAGVSRKAAYLSRYCSFFLTGYWTFWSIVPICTHMMIHSKLGSASGTFHISRSVWN